MERFLNILHSDVRIIPLPRTLTQHIIHVTHVLYLVRLCMLEKCVLFVVIVRIVLSVILSPVHNMFFDYGKIDRASCEV
jgi:hypothetical protein